MVTSEKQKNRPPVAAKHSLCCLSLATPVLLKYIYKHTSLGRLSKALVPIFGGVGKGSQELKNSPTVDPKERTTVPVKQKRVRAMDINGSVLSY